MQDIARAIMPGGSTVHDVSIAQQRLRPEEFWAVSDVSFQVRRGECLGLIGHNGAGKSTLLKLLNGLNRPDRGRIKMRGRVGALIELSAGFNPVLTGRENIYNQAALLGFSKAETELRFDAIVDFSELEEFLDMPVQNYSSGMRVKLGFAVSSQMEPDILLIDEVLAVGDLGFRFKCLNKIADLLNNCAVVFVSHSMPQVMRVATDIMLLTNGKPTFHGSDVAAGLEAYFNHFDVGGLKTTGSGEVQLTALKATSATESCFLEGSLTASHGSKLAFDIGLNIADGIDTAVVQVLFWNHEMLPVLDVMDESRHGFLFHPHDGKAEISVEVNKLPLNGGRYQVSVIVTHPDLERVYCQVDHAVSITVSTGSPASGAGCVQLGGWIQTPPNATGQSDFSLATRLLLEERTATNEKISQNDACIFEDIRQGDIAIDCGANVGVVTEMLAAKNAEVYAFEPDPNAFQVLQEKFGENANVHLHNQAVSKSSGSMKLYFREEHDQDPVAFSVGSTLLAEKIDVDTSKHTEVQVIRLFDFIKKFERVRFLKLDIEGAECDVLEDLLQNNSFERIDLTVVETHEEWIPESIPRLQEIRSQLAERRITNVFLNWI